jgi:hypothetical protein
MKTIHEMRKQALEGQKSASPLPIFLGAVIAFGIGLLGVSGIVRAPALLQAKTQVVPVAPRDAAPASVRIDTSSHRVGRAETAPLLKLCVPFSRLGFDHVDKVPPGDLYRILQTASGFSRVASVAGIKQNAVDEARFAAVWADVADCIYRQNGWMLCDPDNRALAIEAATTLIRQLSAATKADKQPDPREKKAFSMSAQERAYALRNADSIKARVLASLRTHASEGRLIASDFGLFTPSELTKAVSETKVTRDACAGRS